jgi:predicted GNAT family acetyltransferase
MNTSSALNVVHRPEASRFEVALAGGLALCAYRLQPGEVSFTHTEVPQALEGRGIAAALVAAALAWARAEGLRVRPLCSYVAAYIKRHPEALGEA